MVVDGLCFRLLKVQFERYIPFWPVPTVWPYIPCRRVSVTISLVCFLLGLFVFMDVEVVYYQYPYMQSITICQVQAQPKYL